ncbi:hypothetical protein AC1031_005504 [Aphanomyces cochlioides]|nr:hypothetical protein AC1031_005504 [Aphanomyces cochlioides]
MRENPADRPGLIEEIKAWDYVMATQTRLTMAKAANFFPILTKLEWSPYHCIRSPMVETDEEVDPFATNTFLNYMANGFPGIPSSAQSDQHVRPRMNHSWFRRNHVAHYILLTRQMAAFSEFTSIITSHTLHAP